MKTFSRSPSLRRTYGKYYRSMQTKAESSSDVTLPTDFQLRAHYISNSIPFVGFGIVDQTGEGKIHYCRLSQSLLCSKLLISL